MRYGHRVLLALTIFFSAGAYGIGALIAASREFTGDAPRVGHGSVKFPPQHVEGGAK